MNYVVNTHYRFVDFLPIDLAVFTINTNLLRNNDSSHQVSLNIFICDKTRQALISISWYSNVLTDI